MATICPDCHLPDCPKSANSAANCQHASQSLAHVRDGAGHWTVNGNPTSSVLPASVGSLQDVHVDSLRSFTAPAITFVP